MKEFFQDPLTWLAIIVGIIAGLFAKLIITLVSIF